MAKTTKIEKKPVLKLSEMTPSELLAQAKLLKEKIAKFRLEKSVGKVKNVREGFVMRKKLARILTALKK